MNSERALQIAENANDGNTYEFAEFSFNRREKILRRNSETVSLPPKTCELLLVLLENHGRLLGKEELMEKVWADTFVEEANLSHHIRVLRKALGENDQGRKFIETVPRRGYRFAAPVNPPAAVDELEIIVRERTTTKLIEEIETIEILPGKSDSDLAQTSPAASFFNRSAIFLLAVFLALLGAGIFFWSSAGADRTEIPERPSPSINPLAYTRLTSSGKVGAASISPDGKFVTYIQNYTDGVGAIYVRQIETNIERRLAVHDKGEFGTTAFSPDGAFIFYVARDAAHPDFGVYRISIIDGAPVRLVEKLDNNYFALAPDGSQIAVVRRDEARKESSLTTIKLDGSGAEQILLTRPFQEMRFEPATAWSPEGRSIALPVITSAASKNYSQDVVGIKIFDLMSGELKNYTDETWSEVGIIRFMPEARGIVVVARQSPTRNQIYHVAAGSGKVSRITNDTNGYGNYGLGISRDGTALVADVWEFQGRVWTLNADGAEESAVRFPAGDASFSPGLSVLPDGRVIYSTRTGGNVDLWTLGETDMEAKPLTSDAFQDSGAVASPDGSFLVFASDRAGSGTSHLFRLNLSTARVEQLTFGEGFEFAPDISPDGQWIIYHSNAFAAFKSDWTHTIRKMPTAGGASVLLFENCNTPAFAPDGRKFSCIVPGADNYHGTIVVGDAETGEKLKSFEVDCFFHRQLPARFTPDGAALLFRNIENQTINLWKQPLTGGSPSKFTKFKSESIFNFVFTRDGKRLLISRGVTTVNVVLIRNFH